jgi:hypothetical protein
MLIGQPVFGTNELRQYWTKDEFEDFSFSWAVWSTGEQYQHQISVSVSGFNKHSVRSDTVLNFESLVIHEKLMSELDVILPRVLRYHPSVLNDVMGSNNSKEYLFKTISLPKGHLKGTPEEQFLQLLIFSQGNLHVSSARDIAKKTQEKYIQCSFKEELDVSCYLDPLRGQWGKEFYPIAKLLPAKSVLECADPEYRNFLQKLYGICQLLEIGAGKLLETFPLGELLDGQAEKILHEKLWNPKNNSQQDRLWSRDVYLTEFLKLPFSQPEYRKWARDYTIADILFLGEKLNKHSLSSADLIWFSTTQLTQRSNGNQNLLAVTEGLADLLRKAPHLTGPVFWGLVKDQYLALIESPHRLNLIKAYFSTLSEEHLTEEHILTTFQFIQGNMVKTWCELRSHGEFVAWKLSTGIPPSEIMEILQDVALVRPLSLDEWGLYVANYSKFKGYPAAWWIPLLPNKSDSD